MCIDSLTSLYSGLDNVEREGGQPPNYISVVDSVVE